MDVDGITAKWSRVVLLIKTKKTIQICVVCTLIEIINQMMMVRGKL